jgi:hypothetical protein
LIQKGKGGFNGMSKIENKKPGPNKGRKNEEALHGF